MDNASKTITKLQDEINFLKMKNDELEQKLSNKQNHLLHSAKAIKTSEIEGAIHESEIKFRQIFDFSPVGIVMVGLDKKFIQTNEAFSKSLGYEKGEIIGLTIEDLTYPEDRSLGMSEMKAIMKGEIESSNVLKRYVRKDNQIIWADITISLIRDNEGLPQYFLGVIQDITERKRAEEEILISEKKWKELVESLPQLVWTCSVEGPCDFLSHQWIKFTGIPAAKQLGYGWLEQLHPDDREKTFVEWLEKVKTGQDFNIEFRIRRYDGVYRWFNTKAIPLRDLEGNIIKWFGSNTDFDDIKKSEENLRESQEKFKSIFENSPLGKSMTGIDGSLHVNKSFCDILGYSEEEIKIKKWQELTYPDDIQESEEIIRSLIKGEKSRANYEKRYIHKNGNIVWTDVNTTLQRDKNSNPLYFITTISDISEVKQVKVKLQLEKNRIRTILDLVGDPIFVKDNDHRITLANRAFYDIFGMEENNVIGYTLVEAVPENERQQFLEVDRRVLDTGITDIREEELTVGDFTRTILTRKTRFIDQSGGKILVGSIHDITDIKKSEEKLIKQVEFDNQLIDSLPGLFYQISPEGKFTKWNKNFETVSGYTFQEMGEISPIDLFEGQEKFRIETNIQKVFTEGNTSVEANLITKNGVKIPYYFTGKLVNIDNNPLLIGMGMDISERKQAEEMLSESEEKFRSVFENSPLGKSMTGIDGSLQVNKSFCDILGYSEEEIKLKKWQELTHPDDIKESEEIIQSLIKGEKSQAKYEKRYIHKNGDIVWTDVNTTLQRDKNNNPLYFITTLDDITGRKRTEDEIRQSRKELDGLFEASPELISIIGIDGYFKKLNPAWTNTLGYTMHKLLSEPFIEFVHPDDREATNAEAAKLAEGQRTIQFDNRYRCNDGSYRWLSWSVIPDIEEKLLYCVARDITERKQMEQVLKDAEVKFRAIFDKASDGILLAETGSKTFYMANIKICKMLGYSPVEILKIGLGKIHPEKDMPYAIEQFERMARNEISVATNIPVMRKDGTVFYADITSGFIRLEGKDYLIGIFRDITERKQNEEKIKRFNDELEDSVIKRTAELKDAMELNLKVIETSPLGVFACREDGPCIIANPAVAKISGATVPQMLQLNFRNLDSWKENGLFEKVEIALQTKKEQQAIIHITSTFGKDLWIKYYITTFYSGDILHFLMIIEDVTERKQAEIELGRKSEQLMLLSNELEIIIDSIPGLVFYKDTNNRFIRVNKYMCDAYKMSKKQLEGIHLNDLHTMEEAQAYYEADLKVIRSGQPKLNIDERWETETGIRWVSTSKVPYLNEKNEVIGIIGTSMDITDRKLAEEELQKHRDNLEELVKERTSDLEKTLQNLERSNQELEQFAYVASHDLQEPLRMVSSFTQLLEKRYANQLDNDAKEFIGFAVDGANRMQKLINDLLDFSRITTRGKEFSKLDISTVLAYAMTNLHEKIRETGAIVTNDDLPFIKGDESQLIRLFQNLIDNAIKFRGEESPRIHISFQTLTDYWQISVRDNGIGINPEYAERIFQIFQRLNNDKKYPGTGIGLAVCKRIVERHGGKIWVESEEGNGSTFYFTIKK